MFRVVIIQKYIPHYRKMFFELLRDELARKGIELILIYGQPGSAEMQKRDVIEIPWAIKIQNLIWEIGQNELCWQPALKHIRDTDLVVVEQASKLLLNYVLLARCTFGIQKVAFWGHGRNLQEPSANRFGEWIKRVISIRAHWWFAYNDLSAKIIRDLGFPPERITSVQNAIDTKSLVNALKSVTKQSQEHISRELNIHSKNVAICVSSFYPEKRIPFLIESLNLIREQVPDFEMIFIGDGVDAQLVRRAADERPWIHYLGPKYGTEKVIYFSISKLFLMPGAVGLGVLDSFALETPLITISVNLHGPEVDYLQNNVNGVIVQGIPNTKAYASAVVSLLNDENQRQRLVDECRRSRDRYTIETMVERFVKGIEQALAAP